MSEPIIFRLNPHQATLKFGQEACVFSSHEIAEFREKLGALLRCAGQGGEGESRTIIHKASIGGVYRLFLSGDSIALTSGSRVFFFSLGMARFMHKQMTRHTEAQRSRSIGETWMRRHGRHGLRYVN